MNISNTISYSFGKITGTKEKVPLAAFCVAIVGMVFAILYNLVFAIAGYAGFFYKIYRFFNILSIIAFVVIAIYAILLFVKKKNVLHLLAGIFLILSLIIGNTLITNLCWLVFVVCIAYASFTGEDEEMKNVAKLALLIVIIGIAMNFLALALWRLPRFFYGLYFVILTAVKAASYVMLLVLFLREAEDVGGVKSVVDSIIEKVKGNKTEAVAVQPRPQPEPEVYKAESAVTETVEVKAPENVVTEIRTEAVPAAPIAGYGHYQYKTVAGPVGLTINKNDSYSDGVSRYASIIESESIGGWELDSIHEIPVTKNNGCIAALMGKGTTTVVFNMLIFRKEI